MAEAVFLSFNGDKQRKALLAADGSLGLGSLAAGLGLDPMSVCAGEFTLEYNPSTGRCQRFDAVLQCLRQGAGDDLLGTSPEKPIPLEGRAAVYSWSSPTTSTSQSAGVQLGAESETEMRVDLKDVWSQALEPIYELSSLTLESTYELFRFTQPANAVMRRDDKSE